MLVNVLTRTSNRPHFFHDCRKSVLEQEGEVFHIVANDAGEDYPEGDVVLQVKKGGGTYPYNLYFNEMVRHAKPGLVVHLDDDDCFTSPKSISRITEAWKPGSMLIWKAQFGNRVLPYMRKIVHSNVTGIAFAIHTDDWIDWENKRGGDYHVMSALNEKLDVIWIDDVLTALQRPDGSAGGAQRRDK